MEERIALVEQKQRETDNRVASVESKVTDISSTIQIGFAATHRRLEHVEKGVVELQTDMTEVKTKVTRLETKVSQLDAKVDKLDAKVEQIGGSLSHLQTNLFDIIQSAVKPLLGKG